ncbi:hypothetical protein [Nocardia transvalensis]|uniref:hypothetical protein n=1 Tax=Nocardia transvalensis TaxID=37333 RepID=UPI0018962B74|nr:hypothetical protein [Nocardia transvalensis]MBF6333514.1 hypothetical protein [Nocardia transvalensis]
MNILARRITGWMRATAHRGRATSTCIITFSLAALGIALVNTLAPCREDDPRHLWIW